MINSQLKYAQLLARASSVEKRMGRIGGKVVPEITDDQLQQLFRAMARELRSRDDDTAARRRCNLLVTVINLMEDGRASPTPVTLSLRQICQFKLIEALLQQVERQLGLHPTVYRSIQPMQIGFARCLMEEPGSLFDGQHPMRLFFEQIVRIGKGYDESSGARARELLELIEGDVLSAVAAREPPSVSFSAGQSHFGLLFEQYRQALNLAEQRHIAKEHGHIRLHRVRLQVHRTIADTAGALGVPEFVLSFLEEIWSKYLYVAAMRGEQGNPEWEQAVSDMRTLVWSVAAPPREDLMNRLEDGTIGAVIERLKIQTETVHHSSATRKFFEQIKQLHRILGLGRAPDPAKFGRLDVKVDAPPVRVGDNPLLLEPELIAAVPGCWYRIPQRGLIVRSKLIEKNAEDNYLLFSNYSGIRVAKMELGEFLEQIRIGYIEPIEFAPVFERLLRDALLLLEEYIQGVSEDLDRREFQRQAERRAKLRRLIEEEEKKRQEEQRQADERAHQIRESALAQATEELEKMEPGAMIELIDEQNRSLPCSLALKLKSSRKLVFVDRNGRKVAEFTLRQLSEKVLDGSAGIINYGTSFDKTLEALRWAAHTEAMVAGGTQ